MSHHITQYFAQFPEFNFIAEYDWRQLGRFNSLAMEMNWDQHRRDNEYINLQETWAQLVEEEFGEKSIEGYQELCEDLDITPIPESISACERELRRIHVNLVEVIQYRCDKRSGGRASEILKHRNADAAKEYARARNKILPADVGKVGVLRKLVR